LHKINRRRGRRQLSSFLLPFSCSSEGISMKKYSHATTMLLALTLIAPLLAAACGKTAGETIDDATVTTRVKTVLLNDPDVGGLRIDVDTFKGVVTLSGAVKSPAERDKAVALARQIGGVKDVKSTLQVQQEESRK
jgi:hypothetical protein